MAARSDNNQPVIVATLRQCGASVCHLHAVGRGVPDLLVGYRGYNMLVEVKTATGHLNALQETWHTSWRGQVAVIYTTEDAVALLQSVTAYGAPPFIHVAASRGRESALQHAARFRAKYKTKVT